jgi:hypothetical protein
MGVYSIDIFVEGSHRKISEIGVGLPGYGGCISRGGDYGSLKDIVADARWGSAIDWVVISSIVAIAYP